MSTTQIPQRPANAGNSPPPQSHENDFYDSRRWESAYRDWHATPELLIQLQDELDRSRMREAFWISVIVHLVVAISVFTSPIWSPHFDKLWAKWFPARAVLLVTPPNVHDKELTYLAMPPDAEKLTRKPNTNIISDKNRVAMSRNPQLDRKELKRILDSSRPGPAGPPKMPGPVAQAAPPAAESASPQPQPQAQAAPQQPPPQTNQMAKLQPPAQPKVNFGAIQSQSAQSAITQAARAAATNRGSGGYGGAGGDYGLGQGRQPAQATGGLEVTTDTMGVDFGPYLERVLHDVKENWYLAIPEGVRDQKGKLAIEFAIMKDGRVAGMKLLAPSGNVVMDRAAWSGITGSNPFPPLPTEFKGDYLGLRFYFYYNPDRNELQ